MSTKRCLVYVRATLVAQGHDKKVGPVQKSSVDVLRVRKMKYLDPKTKTLSVTTVFAQASTPASAATGVG